MHNIQIINFRYRPTQRKYQLHRNRAEIGNKSMETQSVWLWHAAAINHNLTWHTCDALGNRLIVVYDTLIVSECDDAAAPKCFSSINNNIYNIASIPRPDPNKFHKQTNPFIHNFPCIFITSWQHNRKNWQPFGTTFERATWCWVGLSTMGNCSFFVCVLFLLSTINSTTYLLDQKSRQQRRHNKLHSVVKICHFYCEAAFIMFLDHWLPLNPYNRWSRKKSITALCIDVISFPHSLVSSSFSHFIQFLAHVRISMNSGQFCTRIGLIGLKSQQDFDESFHVFNEIYFAFVPNLFTTSGHPVILENLIIISNTDWAEAEVIPELGA